MSVLIVGSTALDSIRTPFREHPRLLGGSASHAAIAASFFGPVKIVGIVGDDFPSRYCRLFERQGIDLTALERAAGKTFHWAGEYELNMNNRQTLTTELGVFGSFVPKLPPSHRRVPYVLLANIAPGLQHHVLDQMERPRFVVADTMDLWLNTALKELLKLLKRVDAIVLNDSEARQLSREHNLISAARKILQLGPRYVIIKKGEHGSMLCGPNGLFLAPAVPLVKVVDPTGAGDSFAGGLVGYLAAQKGRIDALLPRAMIYGSVVASFCCEGFGVRSTITATREKIEARVRELERIVRF